MRSEMFMFKAHAKFCAVPTHRHTHTDRQIGRACLCVIASDILFRNGEGTDGM